MTRQKHINWCKQRALEYVDRGEIGQAVTSMLSDLNKHPETQGHIGGELGMRLLLSGLMNTTEEAKKWIEGFN